MTTVMTTSGTRGFDAGERPRVALYSHDAQGLGHIRRNLAIAHALAETAAPDILLLTGARGGVVTELPDGCDIVSLPAIEKGHDGGYAARHLSFDTANVTALRSSILTAALTAFRPHVLIVDKHARGWNGELAEALDIVREAGTRVVFGVRDVLDDSRTAQREWQEDATALALEAWYEEIWVYGDRGVHDPLAALELPDRLHDRLRYTGYLANGRMVAERSGPETPYVLAMVGAGTDGGAIATTFLRTPLPDGHRGVLVTGPHMPKQDRELVARLALTRPDIRVHDFVTDSTALVRGAAALVGMGGYNTVCEAMAMDTPMLIVPRVGPRAEQLVRAVALARRGVADIMLPRDLHPAALAGWLDRAVCTRAERSAFVDLDGLARVPELLAALIPNGAPVDADRTRKGAVDA